MSIKQWQNRPIEDAQAARIAELEAALLIYADMTNWSVRSLLPEDYAEPDEWIGPEIPGYIIARRALENEA